MTDTPSQPTKRYFSNGALEQTRYAIEEAGGNEVFLAGALNGEGLVERVRVCGRGHDAAVPAFFESLAPRDIVIHNHPSGHLLPSDADLNLAAIYSRNGHGVFIIDNAVEHVYVVVEPFLNEETQLVAIDALLKVFRPAGKLSKVLPGFEVRPQQKHMAESVAEAFNNDGIAVIEAPTGVGKTLAYLLPALTWALQNRQRVIVATKTINLQEQLMFKDIPLVQKCLGVDFEAVLVKGRQNYLCQQKLNRAFSETTLFDDDESQDELKAIADWADKTVDGSRSDLAFVPSRDLWDRVCCDADACLGNQCPSAQKCFLTRARRNIAKADLIVANHHMLFSDLSIKQELGSFNAVAVLPAYDRVILDEAHNVEDAATAYFGVEVSRSSASRLFRQFKHKERGRERGLLPYLKLRLMRDARDLPFKEFDAIQELMDTKLEPALNQAKDLLKGAFSALRHLTAEECRQIGRDVKWRLTETVLQRDGVRNLHGQHMMPVAESLRNCAAVCSELLGLLDKVPKNAKQDQSPILLEITQLRSYRDRLETMADVLAEGMGPTLAENTVRWVEIDAKNENRTRLARCPLEIAKPMADWVYPNLKTLVMTSATLTVGRAFDYFEHRVGLSRLEKRPPVSSMLDTPFDFKRQAKLCVPTDLPEPQDPSFNERALSVIREALHITRGHAFVLFTSFYALDYTHQRLEAELSQAGITPLRQGEASRTYLLDRFRKDAQSVLFATDSFWEGVDVAGDSLQCVILCKLPFRVPTEPVLEARSEAIEAQGGNAFMDYTVPQAVIKFRQGFGRLIRRTTDRGAVVVLDRRVVTKRYGRVFMKSLPDIDQTIGTTDEVLHGLRTFFDR